MSIAVGLVCSDGVVTAVGGGTVRGGAGVLDSSVGALQGLPVIWSAVGSVYVIDDVGTLIAQLDKLAQTEQLTIVQNFKGPRLEQVKQNLATYVRDPMKRCYESALPGTQPVPAFEGMVHPFATDFLVMGYAGGTPWFIEVAHDGRIVWRTGAGHHAVGAGGEAAVVARALLATYAGYREIPLEIGKAAVYRTVRSTMELASGIRDAPVQIAVCGTDGTSVLDEDQIAAVGALAARWAEVERESLRALVGSPVGSSED